MEDAANSSNSHQHLRVLLLEPVQLIGTLWQRILVEEPTIGRIEVFDDSQSALKELGSFDLAITGPSLSHAQAVGFTRQASLARPELPVVVTGLASSEAALLQAAEAGAAGLVLREQPIEEALEAIRSAAEGEARIAPEVAPLLMEHLAQLKETVPDVDTVGRRYLELTAREREVLDLIGRGLTNQQIADRLVLELGTVKNHVHRILEKLDKRSRYEAAGYLRSLPPDLEASGE